MTPILARQRPDRSLERLYKKHAGDVYRYALVVLRNQADAEDVTQTTFLNAYRALERGERPRTPQNWLIAIAHNVCRQRFRQSQRRPAEIELNEELAEAYVEEDTISAEDIRRALGHLGFNQRSALVMRELEGRSYQEIAEILGLSVSAVETLIFRARRALREQLEEGITCHDAELSISKQLDGRLGRKDKGALRAHLRECEDCAGFARRQRAQRGAIKSLAMIPLPSSLASLFGGGGAAATGGLALGGGLGVKLAAIGASALVVSGVSYEGVHHHVLGSKPATPGTAAAHPNQAAIVHAAPNAAFKRLSKSDLKPYKPKAVKSRGKHKGRPFVVTPAKRHHEVSALPPSRDRVHELKPTKPAKPVHQNNGHHRTPPVHKPKPIRTHTPPPPPPPPPPHGKGKGKGGGGTDGTHGNSGK